MIGKMTRIFSCFAIASGGTNAGNPPRPDRLTDRPSKFSRRFPFLRSLLQQATGQAIVRTDPCRIVIS